MANAFKAQLIVKPRAGVRDPQGDAVDEALRGLDYEHFKVHCVGRYLEMDIEAADENAARQVADDMCKRLLVNPNLETYELRLTQA